MEVKRSVLLISFYAVLVIGFGFWWADNFHRFTNYKGDESFFEIEFIGIISLFTSIIFKLINRKISWWVIISILFSIQLSSAIITFFMPVTGLITGTTLDDLRVYGLVQALFTIAFFCILLYINKKDTTNHA